MRTCTSGVKHLLHPMVGAMEPSFENLVIPGTSGQRLIAYTPEPDTPSQEALSLLSTGGYGVRRVRTRGASSVMATVCSEWAVREPSAERMVQPSGS
ncbi:hypothetical protein [Actinomadura meridiana]|uniref:MmyB family transcriptional regulator n=1 Tax=Actinomadura meridiana TaxID=559626 RepID=UPI003CD09EB5